MGQLLKCYANKVQHMGISLTTTCGLLFSKRGRWKRKYECRHYVYSTLEYKGMALNVWLSLAAFFFCSSKWCHLFTPNKGYSKTFSYKTAGIQIFIVSTINELEMAWAVPFRKKKDLISFFIQKARDLIITNSITHFCVNLNQIFSLNFWVISRHIHSPYIRAT